MKELQMFSILCQYINPALSTNNLRVIYYGNFSIREHIFRLVKPVVMTLQKVLQLRESPVDWTIVSIFIHDIIVIKDITKLQRFITA